MKPPPFLQLLLGFSRHLRRAVNKGRIAGLDTTTSSPSDVFIEDDDDDQDDGNVKRLAHDFDTNSIGSTSSELGDPSSTVDHLEDSPAISHSRSASISSQRSWASSTFSERIVAERALMFEHGGDEKPNAKYGRVVVEQDEHDSGAGTRGAVGWDQAVAEAGARPFSMGHSGGLGNVEHDGPGAQGVQLVIEESKGLEAPGQSLSPFAHSTDDAPLRQSTRSYGQLQATSTDRPRLPTSVHPHQSIQHFSDDVGTDLEADPRDTQRRITLRPPLKPTPMDPQMPASSPSPMTVEKSIPDSTHTSFSITPGPSPKASKTLSTSNRHQDPEHQALVERLHQAETRIARLLEQLDQAQQQQQQQQQTPDSPALKKGDDYSSRRPTSASLDAWRDPDQQRAWLYGGLVGGVAVAVCFGVSRMLGHK